MVIDLPELVPFQSVDSFIDRCAFVFAMGFEDRALAIPRLLAASSSVGVGIGLKYTHTKGQNRESESRRIFADEQKYFQEISYSSKKAFELEYSIRTICKGALSDFEEVVIDISAMSKFVILVFIVVLLQERKRIRIVFATASDYAPNQTEFNRVVSREGERLSVFASQPSSGVSAILRSVCLSSSRMQGQPVCAVAFTSFNEELIRHCVGTLNPHRLILLNGIPPEDSRSWRAHATQLIHKRLIDEYAEENPIDANTGLLVRSVSTLDYRATLQTLLELRQQIGTYERTIYFATGSKMQTVGLALLKAIFADVHIEYPTPDSYFFAEYSKGVGDLYCLDVDAQHLNDLAAKWS